MSLTGFWAHIDQQYDRLTKATSAEEVIEICPRIPDITDGRADGFFEGSGGDKSVRDALLEAGWTTLWIEASYFWAMQSPSGSTITYVEGDLYIGNQSRHRNV